MAACSVQRAILTQVFAGKACPSYYLVVGVNTEALWLQRSFSARVCTANKSARLVSWRFREWRYCPSRILCLPPITCVQSSHGERKKDCIMTVCCIPSKVGSLWHEIPNSAIRRLSYLFVFNHLHEGFSKKCDWNTNVEVQNAY